MDDVAHGFLDRKRILIVGAGYLGGTVARRAVAAGAQVTALTRRPEQASRLVEGGAMPVVADLETDSWHDKITTEPDLILNCVGAGHTGLSGYRRSYVDGFRSLLDWGRKTNCSSRLIYTSSTSVYLQDGGVRVDESAPVGHGNERGSCLIEAEQLAAQWPGPTTVLRLAGLYGPGRHHLLDELRRGAPELSGPGDRHLNLIHVDDATSAIVHVWRDQQDPVRYYNVADDSATPKVQLVEWLARRVGCAVPAFSENCAAARRFGPRDRIIANDRLKRELGWCPDYPSFREGYQAIFTDEAVVPEAGG